MSLSPYIFKLADDLLKTCTECNGIGQRKGYQMAPISVNDVPKSVAENDSSFSHVITRCEECLETGLKIDWDKWCQFQQENTWPVVAEVKKVFDSFYHEVPQ